MDKPFPGKPARPDEDKLVLIGTVSKPQGLDGGVRMWPAFNSADDFEQLKTDRLFAKTAPSKSSLRPAKTEYFEIRLDEFSDRQRFIVIYIDGVDDPETAERLRDMELYVYEDELWDLPEGQFYTYELTGLDIVDDETGNAIGTVKEVQTGVVDYFVVQPATPGAKTFLVPNVPEIVLKIDKQSSQIRVRLPEGIDDI